MALPACVGDLYIIKSSLHSTIHCTTGKTITGSPVAVTLTLLLKPKRILASAEYESTAASELHV